MTLTEKRELLSVMPVDDIQEYMARYGFTTDEVAAELIRRERKETLDLLQEIKRQENELDALELRVQVRSELDAKITELGLRFATDHSVSMIDYLTETYWTYEVFLVDHR